MTKRPYAPAAALLAILAGPTAAAAQDAHYWTYGYGPIGQLTEGALVGGVEDLSAVYYNPGALALVEEPRFVFGLTSIELAKIKAPDAAGQNLDFDSFIFDTVPAVVAGHIGENRGQANHFAFAFLSRHDTDWDLGYSNAQVSAASPDAVAGFGRVRERLVEYWVGGTWCSTASGRASRSGCPPSSPTGRRGAAVPWPWRIWPTARRARGLRREGERLQPRAVARQGRHRLAPRPLGARRHGHHRGPPPLRHRQGGLQRVGSRRGVGARPLREHAARARRHVPRPLVGGRRGDVAR